MRAMGDKIAARAPDGGGRRAGRARLAGDDLLDAALVREAARGSATRCWSRRRRAAAGGACAACDEPAELERRSRPRGARRTRRFGDDRVFLERLSRRGARHVEVQVLADAHGACVAPLRARLLDPAATPEDRRGVALAGPRRERARRWARRRSRRRGGRLRERRHRGVPAGAMTATSCFLELNTRLQVEHPGHRAGDRARPGAGAARVAAGEPLELEQADVDQRGHALECRLYAEDPAAGFLPATGRLPPASRRRGRACGSTPACARATRSACATTRCSRR